MITQGKQINDAHLHMGPRHGRYIMSDTLSLRSGPKLIPLPGSHSFHVFVCVDIAQSSKFSADPRITEN